MARAPRLSTRLVAAVIAIVAVSGARAIRPEGATILLAGLAAALPASGVEAAS